MTDSFNEATLSKEEAPPSSGNAHDNVIQDVWHPDQCGQAEEIPPEEAAQLQQEQWASGVKRLIEDKAIPDSNMVTGLEVSEGSRDSPLVILEFGRHPKSFDAALMESPLAIQLVADGVDIKPDQARGMKILARGVSLEALHEYVTFGPRVVVVAAADEEHVYSALAHLPYSERPRVKRQNGRLVLDEDLELFQDLSDDDDELQRPLPVERTFINFRTGTSSASSARTVSTSQMRNLAIGNPRAKAPRLR